MPIITLAKGSEIVTGNIHYVTHTVTFNLLESLRKNDNLVFLLDQDLPFSWLDYKSEFGDILRDLCGSNLNVRALSSGVYTPKERYRVLYNRMDIPGVI